MSRRAVAAVSLVLASVTFWISWALMPDAATKYAAHIYDAVRASRSSVFASSVVQLLSSALFAPALVFAAIALGLATVGVNALRRPHP